MKLGELVFSRRLPTALERRVETAPFKKIEDIVLRAGDIWFDMGDKKTERFQKAADNLLKHLTPAVASNPDFYQKVDGKTHNRVLDLLGTFVPREENDLVEFTKGPIHGLIVSYLRGIVVHRVMMPLDKTRIADGSLDDYKVRMASHLRLHSALPNHYLELIYPEVGLPLPPKRQSPYPLVKG